MDPAGLGAIIGISIMLGGLLGMKLYEMYKKRAANAYAKRFLVPLRKTTEEKQPILVKRHWKMKHLAVPKSFKLNHLSVRKF
jgi:hypothetical protein